MIDSYAFKAERDAYKRFRFRHAIILFLMALAIPIEVFPGCGGTLRPLRLGRAWVALTGIPTYPGETLDPELAVYWNSVTLVQGAQFGATVVLILAIVRRRWQHSAAVLAVFCACAEAYGTILREVWLVRGARGYDWLFCGFFIVEYLYVRTRCRQFAAVDGNENSTIDSE